MATGPQVKHAVNKTCKIRNFSLLIRNILLIWRVSRCLPWIGLFDVECRFSDPAADQTLRREKLAEMVRPSYGWNTERRAATGLTAAERSCRDRTDDGGHDLRHCIAHQGHGHQAGGRPDGGARAGETRRARER